MKPTPRQSEVPDDPQRPRFFPSGFLRKIPVERPASGWRVHVALLFVQLFFGAFPVVGKLGLLEIRPSTFALFRSLGAAAVLQLFCQLRREPSLGNWSDYGRVFVYGLLGVTLNQLLSINGLKLTTAMHTTVLVGTIPIFALIAATVKGQEKPSAKNWFGISLGFLGVLFLVFQWSDSTQVASLLGDFMILSNCLIYGIYLVVTRDILKRQSAWTVVAWVFTFGSLAMLPVALLEPISFSYSSRAWGIILFAIAFPSVGAYLLNNYALQRAPASTVAVYIYLQPVISAVLAVWVLDERAGWDLAFGAACIFSGVAIASRRAGNPQPVQNP